jgi:hypothetical protein
MLVAALLTLNLLHVSGPGSHPQGVFLEQGIQAQHDNPDIASFLLELLKY